MSDPVLFHQPDEHDFDVLKIEGALPADLRGTLLRNGPGIQRLGDDPLHFFDGLGMVCALRIDRGRAHFRSRHVRTKLFDEETRAQKHLRRRVFTNTPGRLSNLFKIDAANTAAHDVYRWGDKLIATDFGHIELDRDTLETRGPLHLEGVFRPKDQVGPMVRKDPRRGRLVGYVLHPKPMGADSLTIFELDPSWKVVHRREVSLDRSPSIVHDIAVTEHYYLLAQFPVRLRVASALFASTTLFGAFRWPEDERVTLIVVPRDPAREIQRVTLRGARFAAHFLNAFEREGRLVVDLCATDEPVDFTALIPDALHEREGTRVISHERGAFVLRVLVDPSSGEESHQRIGTVEGDLPEISEGLHGEPYRYAYLASADRAGDERDPSLPWWSRAISKLDLEGCTHTRWRAGPSVFVSQPAFAPREGAKEEDDGYLVAWTLDSKTAHTKVVVLDAKDLEGGPIATLDLGIPLPAANHSVWDEGSSCE